jgi:anti-sigma factor RsiW
MTWFRRSAHPEDDLSAYVDGELGERARRALEAHLASCEACSTLLRELQDTKSLLSELPRLESRRSFVLGREFATARQPVPRRISFTFAPVVALTVLVALLFVDVLDSGGGMSHSSDAFSTAASTQSSDSGGLSLEAGKAPEVPNAVAGTTADSSVPTPGGEAGAPAITAGTAPSPEAAASTLGSGDDQSRDSSASAAPAPQDTSQGSRVQSPEGSSGLSTLRILEIATAFVFAASLLAVFLPRFTGRRER